MKGVFFLFLMLACFVRPALNSSAAIYNKIPHLHDSLSAIEADLRTPNDKSNNTGSQSPEPRAQTLDVVMLSFGILMLLILLWLAVLIPDPTPSQFFMFRVSLALAACAICVAAPGFIAVGIGYGIRATGALAVFLLVYAFNPAKLMKI